MKKILFIEDDPIILKVFQSRLAEEHLDIIVAIDSDEGLRKAKTEHPDLIVLDIFMGEKSGLDTFAALRAEEKSGARIPVIILSTDDREETRKKAEELGIEDYFVKGLVSLREIVARIQEILA
ncbi:MAG: response regulator [Patescibacteria group bacterium]|mgnify:CR=1 FL=1